MKNNFMEYKRELIFCFTSVVLCETFLFCLLFIGKFPARNVVPIILYVPFLLGWLFFSYRILLKLKIIKCEKCGSTKVSFRFHEGFICKECNYSFKIKDAKVIFLLMAIPLLLIGPFLIGGEVIVGEPITRDIIRFSFFLPIYLIVVALICIYTGKTRFFRENKPLSIVLVVVFSILLLILFDKIVYEIVKFLV